MVFTARIAHRTSKIAPGRAKTIVFTVRNALGRSKTMVFTVRIAHRTSKIAPGGPRGDPGRFGGLRGCSRDAPGGARRALASPPERLGTPPDAPRDPPERPKSEPGRPRIDFWERSFQTVARETLPGRFSDVFGSLGGGPDVDSAAPCQCFVRVERFSSKRPPDHKIDRKRLENGPQIAPDDPLERSGGPLATPGERSLAQDARLKKKLSERARAHAAGTLRRRCGDTRGPEPPEGPGTPSRIID